jgi:ubiquinol-cytochrome c reductase cytochrome c subunit
VFGGVFLLAGALFGVTNAVADDGATASGPTAANATGTSADPDLGDPALVAAGEELYLTSCVSCHGVDGKGTDNGPSLEASGAAAADFMLRTGRMPLAAPAVQAPQKPVAYDDLQIRQLVAYVASLGTGPAIPSVDPSAGDLAEGSDLYLSNCAACHNSSGIGGALSYGNHAPSLLSVEPTQIAEAMRIGPGQMPVFGPDTISDEQVDSIVRYVQYLQEPEHPGGLRLGGAGPVPEGFVAWLVGLGVLLLFARWITREHA